MAERQSRIISTTTKALTIITAEQKTQFMWFLSLLVFITGVFFLNQLHASEYESTSIAMADVGAIKTDLAEGQGSQVAWAQLTDEQKKVLAPLGAEWDTLRPWQREKMLDIAKDYPKMDAEKQERVQKRLNSWSRMTPYERENARKRYQQFHSLSPEKKEVLRKKWAEREKSKQEASDSYDPDLD